MLRVLLSRRSLVWVHAKVGQRIEQYTSMLSVFEMHAYVYHNLVCVILTKLRNVCASLSDISYYCIIISTMHKMTLFGTIKQYSFPKCTHLVHQKYWFYNCHHVYQDLVVLETVFFKEFSGNVGNKMLYNLSIISVQIEWMYFYIKNMCTKRC